FPESVQCSLFDVQFRERARTRVIVTQDLPIPFPLARHYGSADLAQSYSVAPARAPKYKLPGSLVHDKRRAVQMRSRQGAPDLQSFPDNQVILLSSDLQPIDSARRPTVQGLQIANRAEIHSQPGANQVAGLFRRIFHPPAKKILRLLVET